VIDQPRTTGALTVSRDIATALARLRGGAGVTARPELDLERVREVEAAFGSHLPDDVLAVFAADVPVLRDRHKMTIGSVVGHTGELREHRAPGDLIGVGQIARRTVVCAQKNADGLVSYDLDDRSSEPFDLAGWLTGLAAGATGDDSYQPALVAAQPESTMSGRRVRHKVFGDGKLLSESGTGPNRKVKVDFPGRGLKLLQARFLEFLD
jgi:hypothetical protein